MRKNRTLTNLGPRLRLAALAAAMAFSAAVASGCASTANHAVVFSAATTDLIDAATAAYEQVNESTVQRKMASVAASGSALPSDTTFAGLIEDENLALRMRLLDRLRDYVDALGRMNRADVRGELDQASRDLHGSVTGLRETYHEATQRPMPVSDDDLALISTAIDALGGSVAERKRRRAVKAVVLHADPAVQEACRLLKTELPGFSDFTKSNLGTIETEMTKAYQDEAPGLPYAARLARLEQIREKNRLKHAVGDFFEDLARAAERMANAHDALRRTLEEDESAKRDFVQSIAELRDLAESIREFHGSLTSAEDGD